MNTTNAYIYANSRIAALESQLLSAAQMERMIGAKSADEAFAALSGTFLAPYVAGKSRKDLARILRKSVSATKRLIEEIVPDVHVFDVLWLRYDFYNLKVIIKSMRAGITDNSEIIERCSYAGVFTPQEMLDAVARNAVNTLLPTLGDAYKEAQRAQQVYEIDFAMNKGYFRAIHDIAQRTKEPFIKVYVERVIDLFNLNAQLRLLFMKDGIDRRELFIEGGSFALKDIETKDAILEKYSQMGEPTLWKDVLKTFEETRNFAILEKAMDDALVQFVKNYDVMAFSVVRPFEYFLAHRNNTQIVRTIISAKESGMEEVDLRRILRRLYS